MCAPEVGIYELSRDAQPIARTANAALQHVAHTEFASDLTHIDILALVGEDEFLAITNSRCSATAP